MGCTKIGHRHVWPTEGLLIIQRCEVRCNFCSGPAAKKCWKYAWFLRRHVRAIHVKQKYPHLEVDDEWDDSKLHRMQLKSRMAQRSGTIKFIEQPEFEEQALGGFHPGSIGHIKQETGDDVDIFNNGPPEFLQDNLGNYPAFADEVAYAQIHVPFEQHEIEAFIFKATVGQTDYDEGDDDPPAGFVEPGEVNDGVFNEGGVVNEDGTVNGGGAFDEGGAADEGGDAKFANEVAAPPDGAPATTIAPAQLHSDPSPYDMPMTGWAAAPKFFMDDYEFDDSVDEDILEDLPLSMGAGRHPLEPSFGDYGRVLSLLDTGAQQMADEGMQPNDMQAVIAMFARGLAARTESRESDEA